MDFFKALNNANCGLNVMENTGIAYIDLKWDTQYDSLPPRMVERMKNAATLDDFKNAFRNGVKAFFAGEVMDAIENAAIRLMDYLTESEQTVTVNGLEIGMGGDYSATLEYMKNAIRAVFTPYYPYADVLNDTPELENNYTERLYSLPAISRNFVIDGATLFPESLPMTFGNVGKIIYGTTDSREQVIFLQDSNGNFLSWGILFKDDEKSFSRAMLQVTESETNGTPLFVDDLDELFSEIIDRARLNRDSVDSL